MSGIRSLRLSPRLLKHLFAALLFCVGLSFLI